MSKCRKKIGLDKAVFNSIGYTSLFLFGMICVIPFYLVVISSFADESSLIRNGYALIPSKFSLDAYRWVFNNPQRILSAYINTICVTVLGTFLSIFLSTMTGYVLSRKDFEWRNWFSFMFFFTTMFNGGLVPWYILCTQYLGFSNRYYALILPLMFSVWNMIIAKNFLKSIPFEITESVKIDGANDFTIYLKIILPLAKPLIATLGLFAALAYWNDWFNCMLFITNKDKQTLQYFLQVLLGSVDALKRLVAEGNTIEVSNEILPSETMKMAMTCIVTGPIIFLYPLVQRYFIKGLIIGAVKG